MKEMIINFIENMETKTYFGFSNGIVCVLRNSMTDELIITIKYNDEVNFVKVLTLTMLSFNNEKIAEIITTFIKSLNA